jgi:hypothetical protein
VAREVQDEAGVRWTCVRAYEGLQRQELAEVAARVEGTNRFRTVCTPSGGEKSIELELEEGWEESLNDDALLGLIRQHTSERG